MMKKIILFGVGKASEILYGLVDFTETMVVAFIDNRKNIAEKTYFNKPIICNEQIKNIEFDYILIGSMNYEKICNLLVSIDIDKEKIISPFSEKEIYNNKTVLSYIFNNDWKITILNEMFKLRLEKMNAMYQIRLSNLKYEILQSIEQIRYPIIKPAEEAIDLLKQGYSMSRFGDGEFEIILDRDRAGFQKKTLILGKRLKEVLSAQREKLLICLADNYGNLDKYTDEAAYAIRMYLTEKVRKEHLELLDLEKVYYDAYLSRPYMIYKDKSGALERFNQIKEVWQDREVVIVEGEGTRMGIGNDLLAGAKSVERIIASSENAFDKYDRIYDCCMKFDTHKLFLIALGPAATVLAYDLCVQGYQALDIGHIDIEYEWFLRGTSYKINIPEKYVNEILGGDSCSDIDSPQYAQEIIYKIL